MHPMFLAVNAIVHQANVLGVFACNVRSAENYIPQKQHVAKVACVVADAVFVGQGMMCPVGCVRVGTVT